MAIALIFFSNENYAGRVYKAAEIVDVAVSIVAGDSFAEPDDIRHSQIFLERGFGVGAAQPGIADLALLIEQALFGG